MRRGIRARRHQGRHRRRTHHAVRGDRSARRCARPQGDGRADHDPHGPGHDGARAARHPHERGRRAGVDRDRALVRAERRALPPPRCSIAAPCSDSIGSGSSSCIPDRERLAVLIGLLGLGFERQLVLSHDTVWCWRGRAPKLPPDVMPDWKPTHVFETIVPRLREAGVSDEKIRTMLVANPRRYFAGGCVASARRRAFGRSAGSTRSAREDDDAGVGAAPDGDAPAPPARSRPVSGRRRRGAATRSRRPVRAPMRREARLSRAGLPLGFTGGSTPSRRRRREPSGRPRRGDRDRAPRRTGPGARNPCPAARRRAGPTGPSPASS